MARGIAEATPDFEAVRGPGDGDRATGAFMDILRSRARQSFGVDLSEQRICGETGCKVDFYCRDEETIVEVALGLPNPNTEFEKDILKALIAQECGFPVKTLFFISRPGAIAKCEQAGRLAFVHWAAKNHDIQIEIHELPGVARVRNRRRGPAADFPSRATPDA